MSLLQSKAQFVEQFMVVEDAPMQFPSQDSIVVYHDKPDMQEVVETHEDLEVSEHFPHQVEIVVDELPGVESLDPELEQKLEVSEEVDEAKVEDQNEAKKSKKPEKWDWESKGAEGFVVWIKERIDTVPKHSGYDTAGVERAISYLEKLDTEISKAMRSDLDGELDSDKIEEVRAKIEDGIERLHDRLDKISKKSKKKKKKADSDSTELVKEAYTPRIDGIVITVPLLISSIVRTCINSTVSAGHDLEDSFQKLSKKFKLTDREKAECVQLFMDMGMPIRRDRGILIDEDFNPASSDLFDWTSQYSA